MTRTDFAFRITAAGRAVAVLLGLAALDGGLGGAEAPESYLRTWNDPAIQQRIDRGIETHRKRDIAIELVDPDGRPMADAPVEVRQTTHEFLFGCNAFVLGQLDSPEKNRRYEEAFLRLFNFATVPFYWAGTEPVEGELRYTEGSREIWRRPPPDRLVAWAKRHGVRLKGHPLLWHAHNPPWLPKEPDALRSLYQKRFTEIADRYAREIPIWDVVNESLVCPTSYPLWTADRDYVRWAFAEAASRFPADTTLMINDVTMFNFRPASDRYFEQIKSLLDRGAAIRGIGFQYHYFRREALDKYFTSGQCDPGKLLDVYEQFGEFGLPLYVTEVTIPSAGQGGDELQAQLVRDHYRLWFSAPRMAGITWWNLGDGTAVAGENEAKGGLVDERFEPKPAYHALDRLINHEWKTRLDLKTDSRGMLRFRGFPGRYSLRIAVAGREFDIDIEPPQPGAELRRVVIPGAPAANGERGDKPTAPASAQREPVTGP